MPVETNRLMPKSAAIVRKISSTAETSKQGNSKVKSEILQNSKAWQMFEIPVRKVGIHEWLSARASFPIRKELPC